MFFIIVDFSFFLILGFWEKKFLDEKVFVKIGFVSILKLVFKIFKVMVKDLFVFCFGVKVFENLDSVVIRLIWVVWILLYSL